MLVNLNLLCRALALFTLCRLASAEDQNANYRLPRNTLSAHYPVRFDKPPLNVAASTLEDSNEFDTNERLGELVSADENLDENDSNASLHTEFSGPVIQHDAVDDEGAQSEQLGDLQPNHSHNELNHRLVRRKDSKSEQPDAKHVIEFNGLDDQPTYSELNDAKNEEDDNGLLKYKAKHDFEYSTNLLNDHSYFFKNAKMLAAGDSEFAYDDQEAWQGTCTDANAKQSPIALSLANSITDTRIKLDIGIRYAKNIPVVELENNGHTVQFLIPRSSGDLVITGPAVDYEVYRATALHFHWGANDTIGSEHSINGARFPLEMHIVHYNTKYVNLAEALKQEDGTLVIGIVFKAGGRRNDAIDPLVRKLDQVRCKGQKADLRDINLLRLFPSKVKRIFQYYGSLTTPPCTPTVNWIVIETPNYISSEQMAKFRLVTEDPLCQTALTRNWRNLQDLKNRDVKRSPKI